MEISQLDIDARAVLDQPRQFALADLVRQCACRPGHMAELGVYRGGSAAVMARAAPNKLLYLYDTFAGLPVDGGNHKRGEFAADLRDVRGFLRQCNVIFRPGLFPATAVDTLYCCVHLDADLYESTRDGIAFFWPRLASGGVLVFDDYGWPCCPGVEQAAREAGLRVEMAAHFQAVATKE